MTPDELLLLTISHGLKMLAVISALGMLLAAELVGAKVFQIDLKKAVDNVETHPLAFSILVTGHFIGAAIVAASAW